MHCFTLSLVRQHCSRPTSQPNCTVPSSNKSGSDSGGGNGRILASPASLILRRLITDVAAVEGPQAVCLRGSAYAGVVNRQLSARQHQRDVASHCCKTHVSNATQEAWRTRESVRSQSHLLVHDQDADACKQENPPSNLSNLLQM